MEKDLIWQRTFCLHVNRAIKPTTATQQGLGGSFSENKVQRTGFHPHHCGFPAKYGTRERPSLYDPAKVGWSAAVIGFTWAPGGTFFSIIQSKSLKSNPSSATSYLSRSVLPQRAPLISHSCLFTFLVCFSPADMAPEKESNGLDNYEYAVSVT